MKHTWISVGIVLLTAGFVLFAAALIAMRFDFSKLVTTETITNTYTIEEAVNRIAINTELTDIEFRLSDGDKIQVDCTGQKKLRHTVQAENGTLTIGMEDNRRWIDHLFFSHTLSMTVYIPSGRYESFSSGSRTGNFSVPSGLAFGSADIRGSTGDVSFGASVEGSLSVSVSTGDILLDNVTAETVSLSVTTGDIFINAVECRDALSIAVSTGETTIAETTCRALTSSGSTGSISMKNTVAADSFEIKRNTGSVRFDGCDAGRINVRTSTGNVTGTLLTEKIFVTRTSAGSVNVPATESGGICRITTSTGDIHLTIAGR